MFVKLVLTSLWKFKICWFAEQAKPNTDLSVVS